MLVSSLDELSEMVAYREEALSDVEIEINSLDAFRNKGIVEYRLPPSPNRRQAEPLPEIAAAPPLRIGRSGRTVDRVRRLSLPA
jgi:hypothetical protein